MQDHLFVFSEYIQNEFKFTPRRSFSLLKLCVGLNDLFSINIWFYSEENKKTKKNKLTDST